MPLSAQQVAEKYKRNLKAAGPSIIAGIDSTDKSQTENAIKAKDKMVANHQAAINRGDWEKGLRESGDGEWARKTKLGVNKIGAGIDANDEKINRAMAQVVEAGVAARSATKDMPNNNLQEGMAKVLKNAETIRTAWGKS